MPKVTETFFHPACVHHVHPAQAHPEIKAGLRQCFEDVTALIRRHVNFPTQLTDIRHTVHTGEAHTDFNLLRCAEGIYVVREVVWRYGLQQFARTWTHNGQNAFACCDIRDHNVEITFVAAHPCLIGKACRGRRHH